MSCKQIFSALLVVCCIAISGRAQQSPSVATTSNSVVPAVSKFSGTLTDASNKPLTAVTGVTFSLYKDAEGGAPLWMETQNIQPDKSGHYSVTLGSTTSTGLPTTVFAAGEARWLGVQAEGQSEKPRVLLMSVPYALKAQDAETLGGQPASAFLQASQQQSGNTASVSGSGKTNYIPLWLSSTKLGDSNIFDSAGNIGIATTTPSSTLDVNGTVTATSFTGSGSGLTNVNAAELGGMTASAFAPLGATVNQFLGTNETNLDTIVDFTDSNSGQYTPGFRFGGTGSGEAIASARVTGSPNQYGIDFWTDFANRMSITNGGAVGIGTTSPGATLDVSNGSAIVRGYGNFQTSGQSATVGVGDFNHTITAVNGKGLYIGAFNSPAVFIQDNTGIAYGVAFLDFSSRRWKTNIQPLHGALDKVEHLNGVSYDLKANGKHQIGLIAEEVGKVVPELVEYEDNGKDAKGVDYAKLTALLIEATKEQQALIRKQQHQLKTQQVQIANLNNQVRTIQTALHESGRTDAGVLTAKANTSFMHP
jgi:hypothetical protein